MRGQILEGRLVRLVPLEEIHKEKLFEALGKPDVWQYTWRKVSTPDDLSLLIDQALENQQKGTQLPFTVIDLKSGNTVGTTRIGDIDRTNRNVEIGWTWLSPDVWGTGINAECKLLLLQHCFEDLDMLRVQFSVSANNIRSRKAVERLGAVQEGVFRKHRVKPDGTVHDNVFYSVLDTEWSEVKEKLQMRQGPDRRE
ncbi:MAG: N-acetyltransferase [Brevibacillus sp.]|jgi:RimJ/RimL family protein N-acetyltransferase|nr:N-acetyltransferase [Brevibacillus sp.]